MHTSAHHGAPASHRYVDDLEGELEAADDAVVSLRRQVTSEKTKLSELERTNTELKARADVYASELAGAQASLDDNGAKLAAAECNCTVDGAVVSSAELMFAVVEDSEE